MLWAVSILGSSQVTNRNTSIGWRRVSQLDIHNRVLIVGGIHPHKLVTPTWSTRGIGTSSWFTRDGRYHQHATPIKVPPRMFLLGYLEEPETFVCFVPTAVSRVISVVNRSNGRSHWIGSALSRRSSQQLCAVFCGSRVWFLARSLVVLTEVLRCFARFLKTSNWNAPLLILPKCFGIHLPFIIIFYS
jgi:hypothetical protein